MRARFAIARRAWRRRGTGASLPSAPLRNSAAATSWFVPPSATSAATRRWRRQAFLSGAPADPAELRAGLLDPGRRAEPLELTERRADRIAGGELLTLAPADDAEREQRAGPPQGIADRLVLRDCVLEERICLQQRLPARPPRDRGSASRAPSTHSRSNRRASASQPSRSALGVVLRPSVEQQLDVVGRSTSVCSAHPSGRRCLLARPCRANRGLADGSPLHRRRARGPPGAAGVCSPNCSSASSSARSECSRASSSWPRWSGDDRDGEMILRHLEPVLDRESRARCGVRGRELPSAQPRIRPTRDPRARARPAARRAHATPRTRARAAPAPPPSSGQIEDVHDRERRLQHQLLAAHGAREVVGPCGDPGCRRFADEPCRGWPAPRGRVDAERVVVELLGELERCACMLESTGPLEARRPRQSAVDAPTWSAGPRRASRSASSSSATARSTLSSSARRTRASARARTCRPPVTAGDRGESCGRASIRRRLDGHALQPSARPLSFVVGIWRRQAKRVFGELGRGVAEPRELARAAASRVQRRLSASGALRRKREVAGAVDRIRDDSRASRPCARRRSSADRLGRRPTPAADA